MSPSPVVVISGCSSGIGAALARAFHTRQARVFATARVLESLAALAAEGLETLALDVTDPASIAAAFAAVRSAAGRIDVLVNNAGFGLFGAVSDLSQAALRQQFATNVVGLVAVTQAALPLMLPARRGCIVNIGSVSGLLTTPFAGGYCASKAAVHALSDALRLELAPFGIRVLTVRPGGIESKIADNARIELPDGSIYAPLAAKIRARARASQRGATPAAELATRIAAAALADPPPALLQFGHGSRKFSLVARWLPRARRDRLLTRWFGLERLRSPP